MSADPNPNPDILGVDPVPNPDEPSPHIPTATPEQQAEARKIVGEANAGEIVQFTAASVVVPGDRVAYVSNPLADYDQATVELICDLQVKVDEQLADYEGKNTEAREAKKKHEASVEQLQELIRERRTNRGKPVQRTLFDLIPATPPPVEGVQANATPDKLADLWREYPMERMTRFGMTETDIQKLADGQRKGGFDPFPLRTMGQMADYSANAHGTPGHENRIADFKGVGPGAGCRIEDAGVKFWAWWNAGGMQEYATERGLMDGPQGQPGDGAVAVEQPAVQGDSSEPTATVLADAASVVPVEFSSLVNNIVSDLVGEPVQAEEPYVVPEGAGDEYALGDGTEGEVHGVQEEGAVPEVPESEDGD